MACFSRKKLSFNDRSWNDLECSALIEFIITKGGQVWSFDKELDFWESAARHVVQRTGIEIQRTGEYTTSIVKYTSNIDTFVSGLACRSKVTRSFL